MVLRSTNRTHTHTHTHRQRLNVGDQGSESEHSVAPPLSTSPTSALLLPVYQASALLLPALLLPLSTPVPHLPLPPWFQRVAFPSPATTASPLVPVWPASLQPSRAGTTSPGPCGSWPSRCFPGEGKGGGRQAGRWHLMSDEVGVSRAGCSMVVPTRGVSRAGSSVVVPTKEVLAGHGACSTWQHEIQCHTTGTLQKDLRL